MNKHEQAQRFAEILLTSGLKGEWDIPTDISMFDSIAGDAWRMADAMQAEADKRNGGVPEAILNLSNSKPLECLKEAERDAEFYGTGFIRVLNRDGFISASRIDPKTVSVSIEKEWQPDWSVAPTWAKCFAMDEDGECYFFESEPTKCKTYWCLVLGNAVECFNVGYTGSWQDSLRKRPEGV